jgi:hypothetical protein
MGDEGEKEGKIEASKEAFFTADRCLLLHGPTLLGSGTKPPAQWRYPIFGFSGSRIIGFGTGAA